MSLKAPTIFEVLLEEELEIDLETIIELEMDSNADPFIDVTVEDNRLVDIDQGAGKYGKLYLYSNNKQDLGPVSCGISVTVGSKILQTNRFTKEASIQVMVIEE